MPDQQVSDRTANRRSAERFSGYLPFVAAVFPPFWSIFPVLIVVGWVVMVVTRDRVEAVLVSALATSAALLGIQISVSVFGMG